MKSDVREVLAERRRQGYLQLLFFLTVSLQFAPVQYKDK